MSIERVVSDVRRMKEEYGMTVLLLEDDHFFNDKERAKADFARNWRRWASGSSFRTASRSMLSMRSGRAVFQSRRFRRGARGRVRLGSRPQQHYPQAVKETADPPAVEALRKFNVRSHVLHRHWSAG